ncbi:hypothetical protein A3K55_00670 [Candidatus Shapirobacteria bacterium RBG_13_44_7]|uniref:Uncharacterized protein n=1 Tax=Candidatus Shapirobacteria bacterium RBG_13_44_7 TaxID=1802149 RepID=A0A1F7SGG8_9BACT|nr:MAG: hypothetical protein A3K55_00670 [Candidatus Shapirobacteria bacterium RBG_13_44_7]
MKKILLVLFLALAALFFYRWLSSRPSVAGSTQDNSAVIIYWGIGCPHCEKVKDYVKDNQIDKKISIAYKEVYYDQKNQKELEEVARQCQLDTSGGVGVPLAFFKSSSVCQIGDQSIIDQLNSMLK